MLDEVAQRVQQLMQNLFLGRVQYPVEMMNSEDQNGLDDAKTILQKEVALYKLITLIKGLTTENEDFIQVVPCFWGIIHEYREHLENSKFKKIYSFFGSVYCLRLCTWTKQ